MTEENLDLAFGALSDKTRRALLTRLMEGPATMTELAAPFDMALPTISRHVSVLEQAGLVERRKDAQRRICSLKPEGLRASSAWIDQYRQFWESQLVSLADYVDELQSEDNEDA